MASSSRLSPGQKGSIVAKVSTAGRLGSLTKIVYVITNDPQRHQIQLKLIANIKPPKSSTSTEILPESKTSPSDQTPPADPKQTQPSEPLPPVKSSQ